MRHATLIALFLSSLLLPAFALANGSPMDGSAFVAAGDVRLMHKQDITLEEENLKVVLDGDHADVRVEYRLVNHGGDGQVAYGFPIDCFSPQVMDYMVEGDLLPLSGVAMEADGVALDTSRHQELLNQGADNEQVRTWVVAELDFAAGAETMLTVSYRVKTGFDDWWFSDSFKPDFTDRSFSYLLSPSGNWGDGRVGKMSITVDYAALKATGGVLKEIAPQGHVVGDTAITWNFENFDLSKAQDLKIVYSDVARLMTEYLAEAALPGQYIKGVRASSTLQSDKDPGRYGPANLLDGRLDTAWCEGVDGDGVGQSITLDLQNVAVSSVGLANGYVKSDGIYKGNNRIKTVKMVLLDENGERHEETVELPQREFGQYIPGAEASIIDWLMDYGDGYFTGTSLTLTIEEVYPGNKYRDTCISEIYLLGYSMDEE